MRRILFLVPLLLVACSKSDDKKPAGGGTPGTGYTAPGSTSPARVPLTQADIDLYVKYNVEAGKMGGANSPEKQQALLQKVGITMDQWGDLWARVEDAWTALIQNEKRSVPVPAELAADVELVKTNKQRLDLARQGKELK